VRRSEVLDRGTFGYLDGVPAVNEFNELIDPRQAAMNEEL
jgi:hypothetical protein